MVPGPENEETILMIQLRIPLLVLMLLCCPISGALAAETGAGAQTAQPPDPAAIARLIDEAEAARQKAAELGAEWLKTRELIAQAREAAQHGEFRQAAQLATRARRQGELAVGQAEREASTWQHRVVR